MHPGQPRLSANNAAAEPWRIIRLARTDGRIRELLRAATRDAPDDVGSVGEGVWGRHVLALHDERGTLVAEVSAELMGSAWLVVIGAILARAWDSEDEADVVFRGSDGRKEIRLEDLLPPEGPDRVPGS